MASKIGKFTVIGAGNMATVMFGRMIQQNVLPAAVVHATLQPWEKRRPLMDKFPGIKVGHNNVEAVKDADVVFLGIKPADWSDVREEIAEFIKPNAVVFSILSGIPLSRFVTDIPQTPNIIRCMPNTPSAIGQGVIPYVCTEGSSEETRDLAVELFSTLGSAIYMPKEKYMDMTVTLSGSLPAFYFLILEAMVDAGVHLGLPRDIAFDLASAAFSGSAQYAVEANKNDSHLAQLKGKVTSPGGVTASALFKAEQLGLRNVVAEMVWAGYRRTLEMGNEDDNKVYGPGVWVPREHDPDSHTS